MAFEPGVTRQAMVQLQRRKEDRVRRRERLERELYRQEPELERLDRDTLTALVERVLVHREKTLELFFRFCQPEEG